MFKKQTLIEDRCPPINDDEDIVSIRNSLPERYEDVEPGIFVSKFEKRLANYESLDLRGLDTFHHKDVIIGCTQFIDDLISTHGLENIQLFEHGYDYYRRLDPDITFSTIDTLSNQKILLLELPFPGHLGPRRDLKEIIEKCNKENIDLHLDCAWLTCGMDIAFDFDQPCIKSVGMSLSKCYGLGWSKIGVRWSREIQTQKAIPKSNLDIGNFYLDQLPMDHLVKKYKSTYKKICRQFYLRPSNVIIGAHSIDRNKIYGLRDFFSTFS